MQQATILIPDISGYTHFLTKTELSHSTHIINELLQVIADSIQPKFTLAEIEGDALLTYSPRRIPQSEIEQLVTETYKNFHHFLRVIERDSVCQCGACNMVGQLTLKFVVHYGSFEEVRITQFTKLSGPDMIIAHRLMRNSVDSDEYLLLTDQFLNGAPATSLQYASGLDEYEILGDISYKYADLSYLKKEVASPESQEDFAQLFGIARELMIDIKAPLKAVHAVLTDNTEKKNYVPGLVNVDMDSSINRVGSTHVCEFDGDSFDIKMLQDVGEQDSIIYIEQAQSLNNGFTLLAYYELTKIDQGTRLSFRALTGDREPIPMEMESMVYEQNEVGLTSMKRYIESKVLAA